MSPREQAEAVVLLQRWMQVAAQLELTRGELLPLARLEVDTSHFLNPYEQQTEASS